MAEDGVDVVEDVPLGDGGIVVAGTELFEGPVGDVLAAVGSVFGYAMPIKISGTAGTPLPCLAKSYSAPS